MNAALITVAVFAILFAPFFLLLAVLRFIPSEKRKQMVAIKPVTGARKISPKLATLLEGLAGFF